MQWLSFIGLAFAALFPLVNPLGAVPLFASLTQDYPQLEQRRQAIRSAIFAFAILAVSLLIGHGVLQFFDLSLGMLQIAGGLIVANTGWQMSTGQPRLSHQDVSRLRHRGFKKAFVETTGNLVATVAHIPEHVAHPLAKHEKSETDTQPAGQSEEAPDASVEAAKPTQDISFSPMAMPMLAGPGSIGVTIGLAVQSKAPLDALGSLIGIALIAALAALCLLTAGSINRRLGPSGVDAMTRIFGFIVLAIAVALIANGISSLFGLTLHGATS